VNDLLESPGRLLMLANAAAAQGRAHAAERIIAGLEPALLAQAAA
jgi:hypothetical protein